MNDTVRSFYDNDYHSLRHHDLMVDDEYFEARAAGSTEFYFTKSERNLKIFEYGCGIGQGIAALPHAAGWDLSSEARNSCKARGLNVYDNFSDVPEESWDIVFCRHVLEHVTDPLNCLKDLRKLLSPNGQLLLIVPKERHYICSLPPDKNNLHLYSWNFRTLNNLLFLSGFEPFSNEVRYILGYRKLLPVRRTFGPNVYLSAARLLGRIYNNGELLIRARATTAKLACQN